MFVELVRLGIVLLLTGVGYQLGLDDDRTVLGASLGAGTGYVIGGVGGRWLRQAMGNISTATSEVPAGELLAGAVGGALGAIVGALVGLPAVLVVPAWAAWPIVLLTTVVVGSSGYLVFVARGTELLELVGLQLRPLAPGTEVDPSQALLVDSSLAIDGRVSVLVEQGFVRGILAVPRFVLDEMQGLADAADSAKRAAGRRGLEVLDALRRGGMVQVMVIDDDPAEVDAVDAKLLVVAQRLGLPLATCDQGLAANAAVQGIRVLDPTRLSSMLREDHLPGSTVELAITRAGKEPGQGVGFFPDGTMVVVTDAGDAVGSTVTVTLTGATETAVGKLFFGRREP